MFVSPGFAAIQSKQPQFVICQSPNPMLMADQESEAAQIGHFGL